MLVRDARRPWVACPAKRRRAQVAAAYELCTSAASTLHVVRVSAVFASSTSTTVTAPRTAPQSTRSSAGTSARQELSLSLGLENARSATKETSHTMAVQPAAMSKIRGARDQGGRIARRRARAALAPRPRSGTRPWDQRGAYRAMSWLRAVPHLCTTTHGRSPRGFRLVTSGSALLPK